MKFKGRVRLATVLILLVWSLTWSLPSLAQESDRGEKLKQLEAAAEQLYTHMQQGSVSEAAADMEVLTATLEGLSFQGLTTVEGIHALAEVIMDTKATLAKAEVVPEEWAESSARLRLAVNSLVHPDHALWQQYYTVLAHDLQQMSKARAGGKPAELRVALQTLQQHYEIIRPAAIIRRSSSDISQFTSWLSYVGRLSQEPTWDEAALREALGQGEGMLKELFGRRGDEPVFLPITGLDSPWYWSGMIGLWIVLALGYAGIRKFVGDQTVTAVRRTKEEGFRYRL
ncbi:sporulation protein YpjB [Paenibacillus sanguinis]|uniref:sporulation protein YpjB n=1 Tax=Paenibacillus sanguinis TaxID=225906 RepID=UPI000378574A|nr:sporulation protein YpjB [Paenibacillus sanguinis]